MLREPGGSDTRRNVAVVIAHGVGEADPGYPTTALSAALARSCRFHPEDDARIRNLPDVNADEPDRTFPVHISHGRLDSGERLTFAELYWADLTRIGGSRLDAILGFFRIVFESHHFIDAMLEHHKGAGPWLLRQLLLIASWLLRGPIIGLVITTAVLFAVALYTLPAAVTVVSETFLFGVASWALFLVGAAVLLWASKRDETWLDPAAWTTLAAASAAVWFSILWLLDETGVSNCRAVPGQLPDCRQAYVDFIYDNFLRWGWRLWGGVILLAFAVAVCLWLSMRAKAGTPPILTALGVVLLQFVLWTAILGSAVMPLIYRAEEVKGINAIGVLGAPLARVAETEPAAHRLLNVVPWDPHGSQWLDRLTLGYGFNGFMILCIVVVGATTHFARRLRAKRLAKGHPKDESVDLAESESVDLTKMPRMVVGRWILGVLMVVTFFQALYLLLGMDLGEIADLYKGPFATVVAAAGEWATTWKHTILFIGWASTLALPVLASFPLGNFIHIARDLIDHQYSRRRASRLTRSSRDKERWPRRARIQGRLLTLLDEVVRRGQFDQVIFVVHSQGSVIAFDYLREAAPENKELAGLKPDVVTLGSPLSHLYEHYFYEYVGLDAAIAKLRNNLGRWINLYRVDDYIGTGIMVGPQAGVVNKVIGIGGHTDYWKEDQLAKVIRKLATTAPVAAPQATAREASALG
jgi:hypothetical protein